MRISDWSSDVCSSDLWLVSSVELAVPEGKALDHVGDGQEVWSIGQRPCHRFVFGVTAAEIEAEAVGAVFILPGHRNGWMVRSHVPALGMAAGDFAEDRKSVV